MRFIKYKNNVAIKKFQRGSSTVEAALIMPVVMFSIIALLLYGILMYQKTVLQCKADSISNNGAYVNKDKVGLLPKSYKTELDGKYYSKSHIIPNSYWVMKEYDFYITSEAQIRDRAEFIRNVDLALDLINSDKAQELIDLLKNSAFGVDNTGAKNDGVDNTGAKNDGVDNTGAKNDGVDNTRGDGR